MTKTIDWHRRIGRRVTLRGLHVFLTVVQKGSMAKAAAELGVSQPAVSEVIADFEHALGLRILDRSPRGIEPTIYGRVLLSRGITAFDELKQAIRDMEFLANPMVGEVRSDARNPSRPQYCRRLLERSPRDIREFCCRS
jgi:DNA-binding transcriptional LysR family regulator